VKAGARKIVCDGQARWFGRARIVTAAAIRRLSLAWVKSECTPTDVC